MKKIMLHLIMPNQISGPNTANRLIYNSYLKNLYSFSYLSQNVHSGLRINLRLLNDLRHQIKKENPDLVHVSGLQTSGLYAVIAAKLSKKKILITIRGFSGSSTSISKLKRFIYTRIIEPLQLKLCDYFYTVSAEANTNAMLKRFRKKNLGFIHNSAPVINSKAVFSRADLGFTEDDFLLIYTGRVTYDKGMYFLCEAISKIEQPNIKLLIIGEGSYLKEIESNYKELMGKKIFALGQKHNVIDYLKISDVFIFPTLHENLSNSLLEACAVGLPVIATNVGGNPEVIINDYNGILVKAKTSVDLSNAILYIYRSPKVRQKFRVNNLLNIEVNFNQNKLLKELEKHYIDILGE